MALSDVQSAIGPDVFDCTVNVPTDPVAVTIHRATFSQMTQLCDATVNLFSDTSADVTEQAIKIMPALASLVDVGCALTAATQCVALIRGAATQSSSSSAAPVGDAAGMGLRGILAALALRARSDDGVLERVSTSLGAPAVDMTVDLVSQDTRYPPAHEILVLDTLSEVLAAFGRGMAKEHPRLQLALLTLLTSSRPATRRRATNGLALLARDASDELFGTLVGELARSITESKRSDHSRSLVQTIAAISKSAGYRLGEHLGLLVPLVLDQAGRDDDALGGGDDAGELREHCFVCFESLLLQCPHETDVFCNPILDLCLRYVKYDPNFAFDSDDDEDGEGGAEAMDVADEDGDEDGGWGDEGGDGDFDDGDFSDADFSEDDDMSWKVRRACCKTLQALVVARPDRLPSLLTSALPVLVKRARAEREDSVKIDVILVLKVLVGGARRALVHGTADEEQLPVVQSLVTQQAPLIRSHVSNLTQPSCAMPVRLAALELLKGLAALPEAQVELLVSSEGMITLAEGVFGIISVPHVKVAPSTQVKLEVLGVFAAALETGRAQSSDLEANVARLVAIAVAATEDSYYRVVAEGLRLLARLIIVLRPIAPDMASSKDRVASLATPARTAIMKQLNIADADQDIKEAAVFASSMLLAHWGDAIKSKRHLVEVLEATELRLQSETTRLVAAVSVARFASSPLAMQLPSPHVSSLVEALAPLLKQTERPLRIAALRALVALSKHHAEHLIVLPAEVAESVLMSSASCVLDTDMVGSALALVFAARLLLSPGVATQMAARVVEQFVGRVLSLLASDLITPTSPALFGTCAFLRAVGAASTVLPEISFSALRGHIRAVLIEHADEGVSTDSLSPTQCVVVARAEAALLASGPDDMAEAYAELILSEIDAGGEFMPGPSSLSPAASATPPKRSGRLSNTGSPGSGTKRRTKRSKGSSSSASSPPTAGLSQSFPYFTAPTTEFDHHLTLRLNLLVLGEFGAAGLWQSGFDGRAWDALQCQLSSSQVGVRQAAAYALGAAAAGDKPGQRLPELLAVMRDRVAAADASSATQVQALLVSGLREFVARATSSDSARTALVECGDAVLRALFAPVAKAEAAAEASAATDADEVTDDLAKASSRTAAECAGRLAGLAQDNMIPLLLDAMGTSNPTEVRGAALGAIRFALVPESLQVATNADGVAGATGSYLQLDGAEITRLGLLIRAGTSNESRGAGMDGVLLEQLRVGAVTTEATAVVNGAATGAPRVGANAAFGATVAKAIRASLDSLADPELEIRLHALVFVAVAAHHRPSLLRGVLRKHVTAFFAATHIDKSLIRTIEYGPFRHTVDDGLEARKAAYEALHTLILRLPSELRGGDLKDCLKRGLADVHEIRIVCDLTVTRLAAHDPATLLRLLDDLAEPWRATITKKMRDNAVPQDVERNAELVRSALRAIARASTVPGAETCQALTSLISETILKGDHRETFQAFVAQRRV